MPVETVIDDARVPVKIWTDEVEEAARNQLRNTAALPFVFHHVAAMPDVHLGIGATVGSVIPTRSAIIPAAVGVDIGCGMMAARTSLTANDVDEGSLKKLFGQITRDVPVGFGQHDDGRAAAKPFKKDLTRILQKHPGIGKRVGKNSNWGRPHCWLGTIYELNGWKCAAATEYQTCLDLTSDSLPGTMNRDKLLKTIEKLRCQ